jgi:hypothetical protein
MAGRVRSPVLGMAVGGGAIVVVGPAADGAREATVEAVVAGRVDATAEGLAGGGTVIGPGETEVGTGVDTVVGTGGAA